MSLTGCSLSIKKEKRGEKAEKKASTNDFVLVCRLSSHRHFFIPLIFGPRFIDS
jgi:hypothetical protein